MSNNPLVTLALISYNQEQYIEDAVKSALGQTYSPLQVVISDDCSTDNTFVLIKKLVADYSGPHKVIIHQNEHNLGLAGNVNKAWELSSGELYISQAGDDISLPHRASKLVETWLSRSPRPDLVYSGVILIDENGKTISGHPYAVDKTPAIDDTITGRKIFIAGGCAAAYSRNLHYFTGPLNTGVIAEDFVYSFRALLGNGVAGISEPLVLYRQHSASIIGQLNSSTENKQLVSEKYLKAQIVKLLEYKKAMDAYRIKRPYLRWRLYRQIVSTEMELRFRNSGLASKLILIFRAFFTLRIRLLQKMLLLLKAA